MDVCSCDLRELGPCPALSVTLSGRLAMLAGKRTRALVDLGPPVRVLRHESARATASVESSLGDVREIQFSYARDTLCAVAHNNAVQLVEWQDAGLATLATLKWHSRVVTDVTWHERETQLLASSSSDAQRVVNIWDLRELGRPVQTLSSVNGASQVCWERLQGRVLATSHDGDIKLWDYRKSSAPFQYVSAHVGKIYALDFSGSQEGRLVSASDDSRVKFWHVLEHNQTMVAHKVIKVPQSPVWKVRYTPFGDGLVTLSMQTLLRGENTINLWNANQLDSPVHTFFGHSDRIFEFCWRNCDPQAGREDYQLVTWARDNCLKIWNIGDNLRKMCEEADDTLNDTEDALEHSDFQRSQTVRPIFSLDTSLSTESIREASNASLRDDSEEPRESNERQMRATSSEASSLQNESMGDNEEFEGIKASSLEPGSSLELGGKPKSNNDSMDSVTALLRKSQSAGQRLQEQNVRVISGKVASSVPNTSAGIQSKVSSLKQEFSLISTSRLLTVETVDLAHRECTISCRTPKSQLLLVMHFPEEYPESGHAPIFDFIRPPTNLSEEATEAIRRKLETVCAVQVDRRRRCLEIALRHLEIIMDNRRKSEEEEMAADDDLVSPLHVLGSRRDDNVPYPRTSGARFGALGKLVVFGIKPKPTHLPTKSPIKSVSITARTPRSLNFLSSASGGKSAGSATGNGATSGTSVSSVKNTKNRVTSIGSNNSDDVMRILQEEKQKARVTVLDCIKLQPFSVELANEYHLDRSVPVHVTCYRNAAIVYKMRSLFFSPSFAQFVAETWALLASITANDGDKDNQLRPWPFNPLARRLITSRLETHLRCHDVQTVSMVACLLCNDARESKSSLQRGSSTRSSTMNFNAIKKKAHSSFSESVGSNDIPDFPRIRSSQRFRSTSESRYLEEIAEEVQRCVSSRDDDLTHSLNGDNEEDDDNDYYNDDFEESDKFYDDNIVDNGYSEIFPPSLLDPDQRDVYENAKYAYIGLLRHMGLWNKAVQMSQYLTSPPTPDLSRFGVTSECSICKGRPWRPCSLCGNKRMRGGASVRCSVCRLLCRGITSVCLVCGHGGHLAHLQEWFASNEKCPTGCGCECVKIQKMSSSPKRK